jgi:hypothetical protein
MTEEFLECETLRYPLRVKWRREAVCAAAVDGLPRCPFDTSVRSTLECVRLDAALGFLPTLK